jgi:hypothetical protein
MRDADFIVLPPASEILVGAVGLEPTTSFLIGHISHIVPVPTPSRAADMQSVALSPQNPREI